jgi:hypothetical protein
MKATKTEPYRPVHSALTSQKSNSLPDREKEAYFINEILYQKYCSLHNETLEYWQKLAAGYNSLGIGTLTAEILRKISKNDFAGIEKNVNEDIEKSLKKTGVTNEIVLKNLRKGTDLPYTRFKLQAELDLLQINRIRRTHPEMDLNPDVYSIEDGAISFNDESKARIKEKYCTIRIDTQAKREFQQLTETTLENLSAIKAILLKNGITAMLGDGHLFSETEGIALNKAVMKYITK